MTLTTLEGRDLLSIETPPGVRGVGSVKKGVPDPCRAQGEDITDSPKKYSWEAASVKQTWYFHYNKFALHPWQMNQGNMLSNLRKIQTLDVKLLLKWNHSMCDANHFILLDRSVKNGLSMWMKSVLRISINVLVIKHFYINWFICQNPFKSALSNNRFSCFVEFQVLMTNKWFKPYLSARFSERLPVMPLRSSEHLGLDSHSPP